MSVKSTVLNGVDSWAGLVFGVILGRFGSVSELRVSSDGTTLGGFCGETEIGTKLGFLSTFPPTESSISVRLRCGVKLVFSKILAGSEFTSEPEERSVLDIVGVTSSCCFIGAVIPTGNVASGSGEVFVTHSVKSVCSIEMDTAVERSFEPAPGSRRAAAAVIVSTVTGSRVRGVASLGVEAWLVSVS